MERKGGCCLAPRYGPAGGHMGLKFRPIAPKPAAMAPSAGPAGKRKRKAVAAASGGGKRGRKPKKAAATVPAVVTASVAATPKVDVRKEPGKEDKPLSSSPSSSSSGITSVDSSTPPPLPTTLTHAPSSPGGLSTVAPTADLAHAHVLPALRPVASRVTVETVTATWRDGEAPPSAASAYGGDDDAPAFVSDQWGRVTWMNLAFNRAVSGGDAAAAPLDAGVVLAAKDGAAVPAWGACAGFTCRVRVTYDAFPRRRGPLVAPCDVWRLDAGGYLWRLDLQATLTLSLGGLR